MKSPHWKIWVDTGGTFTDCIAITPDGETKRLKVLSNSLLRVRVIRRTLWSLQVALPFVKSKSYFIGFQIKSGDEIRTIVNFDLSDNTITVNTPFKDSDTSTVEISSGEEVPVFAARILTETGLHESFPSIEMKLGSTRGTNALLERKGAKTVFLVTKGFRDLLRIGNQQRRDLFQLNIIKPTQLSDDVVEVDERILFDGSVETPLDTKALQKIAARIKRGEFGSVAVALINSYKNPAHEILVGDILRSNGCEYVSLSHQLSGQIKILPRAETTMVNAYLDPIIDHYLKTIQVQLKDASLKVMSSAGGLLDVTLFRPKDSLLSGPAGGVVGALQKAKQSGIEKIITFDMGGTSTDVSRCNGRPDYRFDCVIDNLRIFTPSLAIETIAAGGGSICSYDGYKLFIGPHSAGSDPGPACYGRGGPLTITDVNLLLGRIDPNSFSIPLETECAQKALEDLSGKIPGHKPASQEQLLQSMIDIANEKMAEAIRKISIQKGHDPHEYALLCFGGAGGQHACSIAALLKVVKIVVPYDAGLLSAFGIGNAKVESIRERLILKNLSDITDDLEDVFAQLYCEAKDAMQNQDPLSTIILEGRLIFLRLKGQETSIEIRVNSIEAIRSDFVARYKKIYGHYFDQREVEVESIRVIVSSGDLPIANKPVKPSRHKAATQEKINIYASGEWKSCPLYRWERMQNGAHFKGPAMVTSNNSTLFVESGWSFYLDENQNAILSHNAKDQKATVRPGAALLELYTNRFTSLVEEMGTLLQRTSFSVNVKERLDFSCALLDAHGNLVVNAPHIPVHLGSLGVCVRSVMAHIKMEDGDVVITNHPAFGGSHLPDITLIKPVFFHRRLVCFMVNRAHHAEIGGKKPGSMPADATSLEEEGVVIMPTYLIRKGKPHWNGIEKLLRTSKYPSRSAEENLADLNAGLAALNLGEHSFKTLCSRYGRVDVTLYMAKLRQHASALMKTRVGQLSKMYSAVEKLDDGSRLKVTVEKKGTLLLVDFKGSSAVHKGNLNATKAIVNSVVLYVLRLLVDQPVPLNEGLLEHVKIIIPYGLLNPKFDTDHSRSPAVVGGNTEVSQRLTDTLLKAFRLSACSQGTMNNLLFGNEKFGYYETICGGVGAGEGFTGADAVHQHMTNTRITDPEILEFRYPVVLQRFEIRKHSGGAGKWNGGNGIVRQLQFMQPLEVNILSQHRIIAPYGMRGGLPGKVGEQYLLRDGKRKSIKGVDGFNVVQGDILVIKTPGGGGWGNPNKKG